VTYRFLPDARTEFDNATDWYEAQQPGLGDDFIAEVSATIQSILASPHAFAAARRVPQGREVRVLPVHRFNYLLHYEVTAVEIIILSVTHGSRRGHPWRQRLPDPPTTPP
jgi:plasmid stabilization system protein ParE